MKLLILILFALFISTLLVQICIYSSMVSLHEKVDSLLQDNEELCYLVGESHDS